MRVLEPLRVELLKAMKPLNSKKTQEKSTTAYF